MPRVAYPDQWIALAVLAADLLVIALLPLIPRLSESRVARSLAAGYWASVSAAWVLWLVPFGAFVALDQGLLEGVTGALRALGVQTIELIRDAVTLGESSGFGGLVVLVSVATVLLAMWWRRVDTARTRRVRIASLPAAAMIMLLAFVYIVGTTP